MAFEFGKPYAMLACDIEQFEIWGHITRLRGYCVEMSLPLIDFPPVAECVSDEFYWHFEVPLQVFRISLLERLKWIKYRGL
jgi:hypothetical protein